MFRNYFITAWRNTVRNKSFAAINILGLALGLACSLFIYLWVSDEKSIDAFHAKDKQLFQVYERNYYDGKVDASYPTQGLLAEELKKNIPQVQYASGLENAAAPGAMNTFEAGNKVDKMRGMFAGTDFFQMFSFPLVAGSAADAISKPSSLAISRHMAEIFFGGAEEAIGKPMRFDNKEELMVSAVFENIPQHSSIQFDFIRSWADFVSQNNWVHNWGNTDPLTFVCLRTDAKPEFVRAGIKDFIYKYRTKDPASRTELDWQPFSARYLYSGFKNGYVDGGRIEYVRLFSIVAIFILLIACVNFMNLATARSAKRAREIGVRKVIGALRASLVKQFIGEAVLIATLAMCIALAGTFLLLPFFNNICGKNVSIPLKEPLFVTGLIALVLVTGSVAGSYPALFMSTFNPVRVLKGSFKFTWLNLFLRKGLVVFQFALSIMLIVATLVIYRQMQYIQKKNLGYNRSNLLYIPIEGELADKYELFKQHALSNLTVLDISKMRNSPTVIEHHTGSISWPGKPQDLEARFADGVVGYDFVKTMKLQMAAGRDFSKTFYDSASYLLNEAAVAKMGFKQPLGQTVFWGNRPGRIIGVVKDFHFNSLHENIEPLILRLDEKWGWGTILVRIKAGEAHQALASLQKICHDLNPGFPFSFQFSDLEFDNLYKSERVVSQLSAVFAFLAIFISCLGLFGLAMSTAEQRTREISVRKVLGASTGNIVVLLSGNFLQPVLIACLIAFPLGWFAMQRWLEEFAYRIHPGWTVFALAGLAAVLIAMITVSFQSVKAAIANPAKGLRAE